MLPVALVIKIFMVDALARKMVPNVHVCLLASRRFSLHQASSLDIRNLPRQSWRIMSRGREWSSYTYLKTRARSDDEVSDVMSQGDGFA